MPALPWRAAQPAHHSTPSPVVVNGVSVELRRLRDVPRFLLDSVRIRRQVLRANGALGVSLIAYPLRRQFLTLSAWGDRQGVNGLVRTEPHRSAMQRHRLAMAEATFTFWEVDHADLPIDWDRAKGTATDCILTEGSQIRSSVSSRTRWARRSPRPS